MAHNHWPVGPEPQLRITSVCYSWCQSDGRGCPTRSEQWGHAHRYGSGAHAEYSTGTAVLDSRWDGNGYKDGGQHSFAGKGFRSARTVAGESGRRDHQQRAGRFVGESTASNTGGGGTAVHRQDVRCCNNTKNTKLGCVMFNPDLDISCYPAQQQRFVRSGRAYLKENPSCDSLALLVAPKSRPSAHQGQDTVHVGGVLMSGHNQKNP